MGNPPYGAAQKNANDNAKKRKYEDGIDKRIAETYLSSEVMSERPKNLSFAYNNYIRAYRWATDRIGDNDGVICFVTPNSWLATKTFEGFRKTIESEFDSIYVFDLRGDQNSPNWREEGDKIFEDKAKVGVAVVMLIKHKGKTGKARIHYYHVKDGLSRRNKLDLILNTQSFHQMDSDRVMTIIKPKENGDWVIERNDLFNNLLPLAGVANKKFESHIEDTIFTGYSRGYATGRDDWIYNFSKDNELSNIRGMIDEYRHQTSIGVIEYISEKIKWNRSLEDCSRAKKSIEYDPSNLFIATYRPFTKQWFYKEPLLIDMTYKMHNLYPGRTENRTICVPGIGVKNDFTCLITGSYTDLELIGKSQCFPLYWYDDRTAANRKKGQTSLFDDDPELVRHDGISDFALNKAREKYGDEVSKEDIFYYIYGYLHSPEYRQTFSEDLKMSLPRIDFVDLWDDFYAFSEAGRELARLHLGYEHVEPNKDVTIRTQLPLDSIAPDDPRLNVVKMDLDVEKRRLVYNQHIVIEDIPEDAFRYVVNGKTALGWIVDRYAVSKNTKSGIVNDPNLYAGGRYILDLILSVITVSVETMRIVDGLPKLDFGEKKE